jgi:hypothetical protein
MNEKAALSHSWGVPAREAAGFIAHKLAHAGISAAETVENGKVQGPSKPGSNSCIRHRSGGAGPRRLRGRGRCGSRAPSGGSDAPRTAAHQMRVIAGGGGVGEGEGWGRGRRGGRIGLDSQA